MRRITWIVILALLLAAAPQVAVAQTTCGEDPAWSRILDRLGDFADPLLRAIGLAATTTPDGDPPPLPDDDPDTGSTPETEATDPDDGEAGPDWDPMG